MEKQMKRLLVALAMTLSAGVASAQCADLPGTKCYTLDLRLWTAAAAYMSGRFGEAGSTPERVMSGGWFEVDLHALSYILKKAPIRTYDALYVGTGIGSMSSAPLSDAVGPESSSAFPFEFGYYFLAGQEVAGVRLLGGFGWKESDVSIGDTELSSTTHPLMARVEFGKKKPIAVMASVGGQSSKGLRADVPFFRRLNLTASWSSSRGVPTFFGNPALARTQSSFMVGVRTQAWR
jgi:hypothetical protein